MPKQSLKNWTLAIRPKTLPASIAPVFIATAMAFGDGIYHFPTAFMCLFGALAIQIGTNLANDYYDFEKGADTQERIGPVRVTQAGLIPPSSVKLAFIVSFSLSAIACLGLVMRAGWPMAVLGVFAVLSGIFYTAGPRPLGYMGWGDLLAFVFFGPIAVAVTYYVQSFEMNAAVFMAGFAPGLFSVAILTVNNLRDMEGDQRAGKKTLAVRFGRSFALSEYLFCLLTAALIPVFIYMLIQDHLAILTSVLTALAAVATIKTVLTKTDGPSLNAALAATGKLLLIYSILFSAGWIL